MSSFNTMHLASTTPLEASLDRVREHGGSVVTVLINIPIGRLAYCLDPDGDTFGPSVRWSS